MNIRLYDIINNPNPQLYPIKQIEVKEKDFEYDEGIVAIMNRHLQMDKLASEHIYVLGLTYSLYPRGILQLNIGTSNSCPVDMKKLATGLLLMGAEQFMCFHNHPGYERKISDVDIQLTEKYKELSRIIDINFLKHIMITKDYYTECVDETEKKTITIFGQEVTV